MTLIVNLFGAPSAGKSTTRAGVFARLKLAGVNAEEVIEVAKPLTWEKRFIALSCQPYVFGKQLRDMERLIGQVDVIITDSPLILSAYYGRTVVPGKYDDMLYQFVINHAKRIGGVNYFLNRVKPYNPKGRNQTEEESNQVHYELRDLLDEIDLQYTVLDGNEYAAIRIANEVLDKLPQHQLKMV